MSNTSLLDLVFVVLLLISMTILIGSIRKVGPPPPFLSLLSEIKQFPDPSLKLDKNDLPNPVRRYLAACQVQMEERPLYAHITNTGQSRTDPDSHLHHKSGNTYFCLAKPGFFSQDRVTTNLFMWIDTIQRYSMYGGYITKKFFSLIPTTTLQDGSIRYRSLVRYFCEAPWFPWVFEPGIHVTWEPIDDFSALLIVSHHPGDLILHVCFTDEFLIKKKNISSQYHNQDGVITPVEVVVTYQRSQQVQGIIVPLEMNIVWKLPDGDQLLEYRKIRTIRFFPHPVSPET